MNAPSVGTVLTMPMPTQMSGQGLPGPCTWTFLGEGEEGRYRVRIDLGGGREVETLIEPGIWDAFARRGSAEGRAL